MTCDLCSQREATVHLTEIINDQSREIHLCEACAREKGAKAAKDFAAAVSGPLFNGLAELLAGLADSGASRDEGLKKKLACATCGMTYEEFRKSGRLGCAHCYESFRKILQPLLKRIHGSTQHVGRSPALSKKRRGPPDLSRLKEQMRRAVAAESFEEAVRLRDQIRLLEGRGGKTGKASKSGKAGKVGEAG